MKFIFLFLFLVLGLLYSNSYNPAYTDSITPVDPTPSSLSVQIVKDSQDTIDNPYAPPLRYDEPTYRQMGYLKGSSRLPFFGKPAHLKRDKWYYYTILDGIKIPLVINKRSCSVSPGCDSVSTGDIVHVDHDPYTVHLYDIDMY